MHIPLGVVSARDGSWLLNTAENHSRNLRIEEGRTRPSNVMPRNTCHVSLRKRSETAKPASSQGEALALARREHTSLKTQLQDMIMEFIHD